MLAQGLGHPGEFVGTWRAGDEVGGDLRAVLGTVGSLAPPSTSAVIHADSGVARYGWREGFLALAALAAQPQLVQALTLPAPLAPPWSHGWRIAWPNTPAAKV